MKVLVIILAATCLLQQSGCLSIGNVFNDAEDKCKPVFNLTAGLPTYDEIYEKLSCLASSNADKMKLDSIGKSIEGRDIPHVVLSTGDALNKPIILLDSLLHGDETDVLFAMDNLIDHLLKPEFSSLLNNIEWHLLPIINPDGFVAGTRKNLANEGSKCVGVDLNRNFADALNASSQGMCSRDYSVKAFSEPETVALRNFFLEKGSQIKYYLALHGCHENRIIPVLAKNGERATVESMKEMFVKARELKNIGDLMGVGYVVRSPMALDEIDFPEESKYEVLQAPNGNALTYAVDLAGVSKAFVIGHGPNQDKQKIVDGIWFMAQNVAHNLEVPQTTQNQMSQTYDLNDDPFYHVFINYDLEDLRNKVDAETSAVQVSKLWSRIQNLAKTFDFITTDLIFEAYSKMDETRKQIMCDTLNKVNEFFSKFEFTDSRTVYDYFSFVDSWTTEKANAIHSAMSDLFSKIKSMSSQDFVAHVDIMKNETIDEAFRILGEMQEITSSVRFQIPTSLQTNMTTFSNRAKRLVETTWALIQEVKSKFESLDFDTLNTGISYLNALSQFETIPVGVQLNEALKKLNVITFDSIFIPSNDRSNEPSQVINAILFVLKNVATELGELTPDSLIEKIRHMGYKNAKYVIKAFNQTGSIISEIEYPIPQTIFDMQNEAKDSAEQQVSKYWPIMESFASMLGQFDDESLEFTILVNMHEDNWNDDKVTEALTMLQDLAKKFNVPSASDMVTSTLISINASDSTWASEISNMMNNLSEKILSYGSNPQSLFQRLPTMGDVSMTVDKIMEKAQKLIQYFSQAFIIN